MMYESLQVFPHRSGGWRAQVKYKDSAGKWRNKSKVLKSRGKREARKEAETWRDELEQEALALVGRKPDITVAEYVARYIDENAGSVEATTTSGYRTLLAQSIAPALGAIELRALDADAIAVWITDLGKDKSKTTATKAFVLLRAALTVAVQRGLIASNPTDTVKKPKTEKANPNALGEVERGRVAAYVDIQPEDAVSLAIRIALYTGMREAEICGLRWRNVDAEGKTLRVVESLGKARKDDIRRFGEVQEVFSGVYLKRPKNAGSVRTVVFPETVARALKTRRAAMQAECKAAGVPFDDAMFVCGSIDGKPMHPHTLYIRWRALVTAMGLVGTEGKPPTFHDLRHTYATTAIANGVDVKTVSNQMGHSNAAMTLNTYASVDSDAARRAADKMGEALATDAKRAKSMGEVLELGRTGTEG